MANQNSDQDPDPDPPSSGSSSSTQTAPAPDDSGSMHTDPGDTTPAVPSDEEGRGEGDVAGVTQPYTPEERYQQYIGQTEKARANMDKLQSATMPMYEQYRNMLQQDQQMRSQAPQDQQYPAPPSEHKQSLLGAASQMLAVAIPIAAMFGIRGNGYAKGAAMSGLGSFMQNYMKGKEQAANQDWGKWSKQVHAIHESNQERHQIYKDILANHRLAMEDQFKMINTVAKEFMDPTMMKASRTNNMNAVIKHLENQEKADSRFVRGTNHVAKIVKPDKWADYKQYVKDKGGPDPDTDPVGANKVTTYSDWWEKFHASKGARDDDEKEKNTDPSPDDIRAAVFD